MILVLLFVPHVCLYLHTVLREDGCRLVVGELMVTPGMASAMFVDFDLRLQYYVWLYVLALFACFPAPVSVPSCPPAPSRPYRTLDVTEATPSRPDGLACGKLNRSPQTLAASTCEGLALVRRMLALRGRLFSPSSRRTGHFPWGPWAPRPVSEATGVA